MFYCTVLDFFQYLMKLMPYLWVPEESQIVFEVEGEVLWVTADGGYDDDESLLTLELLHRTHVYVLKFTLLQQLPNLLDLF